jgi:acyl-CoA synthetase (AMP-forming)/AMP-acid ligase II
MHTEDSVGKSKVASGKQFLQSLNSGIQIETIEAKATAALLDELLPSVDIVLDCTDNFSTRHLINASCVAHQTPLVSGSALRFDGQISVFDPKNSASPCYACIFSPDESFEEVNCASMGIFSPLVGIIGAMQAAQALSPSLKMIICIEGASDGVLAWSDVIASNQDFDGAAAAEAVAMDDVLTLIYTSGTTGPPKGVEITHESTTYVIRCAMGLADLQPGERVISWLPAAHVAERVGHHYGPMVCAATITCCPDPRQIIQFLPQVRPQFFFAVPRIWEKLKAGLEAMLAAQTEEQAAPLKSALADALEAVRLKRADKQVPADLAARVAESDKTIFAGLRAMFGLDEAKFVGVGAAPTPAEVIEFFHALGIEICEVWGMSETSGIGTANPPGAARIGTVSLRSMEPRSLSQRMGRCLFGAR